MQLKAQIRNKAKDVGTTPQLMMQNYLLERIIERISLSHLRDNVVIKGGVLISSLVGVDKRSTYDLDATIQGLPLTHENAEKAFREIITVDVDDGFSFEFVRTEDIREADDYPGIRVHLLAKVGATGCMFNRTPKYTLIDGREVALVESIPHALSNETVCVFEDGTDNRRYVSEAEWVAGAEEFGR